MNLEELFSQSDYQAFHDSFISSMIVDYAKQIVTLEMDLVVDVQKTIPTYRKATVSFIDFDFVVCQAPDARYPYSEPGEICVDFFEGLPKGEEENFPPIRLGSYALHIWVEDWNRFIVTAAKDFNFVWRE